MIRIVQSLAQQPRPGAAAATISRGSGIILPRGFSSCPFQILGLVESSSKGSNGKRSTTASAAASVVSINPSYSRNSRSKKVVVTYEEVRVAFRELALKHHPDTNNGRNNNSNDSNSSAKEEFTRIRQAFESIMEGPNGMAILRDGDVSYSTISTYDDENESNDTTTNDNYNSFQDEQNGYLHPSINPQILREVANVAEEMNPGGLDKGGMWQYANMIKNMAEKKGKDGLPPLRVGGKEGEDKGGGGGISGRRRRGRRIIGAVPRTPPGC